MSNRKLTVYNLMDKLIIGLSVCMLVSLTFCQGDSFLSLSEMENLFDTEQDLVKAVNDYIRLANFELDIIRGRFRELSKIQSEIKDPASYMENPINAYSVVKRLVNEWPATFNLLEGSVPEKKLPDNWVLKDMVSWIVQWQLENGVSAETMARGLLNGTLPHAHLTAGDCYDIAVHCYHTRQLQQAVTWLRETELKITDSGDYTASLSAVHEYTFLAKCLAGDLEGAVTAFQSFQTSDDSKHLSPQEVKGEYQLMKIQNCKTAALEYKKDQLIMQYLRAGPDMELYYGEHPQTTTFNESWFFRNGGTRERTRELCEARVRYSSSPLSCYFLHFNIPYLRLAPSRVEEQNLRPFVALIHNVLQDNEIVHIIQNSIAQMATLTKGENGPVPLSDDALNLKLNRRMSILTHLDLEGFSDTNQISLFGPGGNFTSVNDFHTKENELSTKGLPIGKVIYFLSEPAQGGLTVFPSLKLVVAPVKGSALFWFNPLVNQGFEDIQMMERGDCPVRLGSKWVMMTTVRKKEQIELN
ncbi:prolyl 4-hydroxylase subunit alpha-2-like [Homalodisca vitripennis]|uniref:prolyl 4-hydroxylase subunit alpha-2-like n=1 Tax=Homalodisca vitripennis TaxID=197043 RepID=UPI001EEABA15|nr:prolyl 4-hydroxylase subunit alpha-2-like [Homalodisca vitripennis]